MMKETVLSCDGISVKYDAGYAVRDVGFSVEAGDCLCIVGENGSGKSTLMKALLGLIPVQGGRVRFDGPKKNEIGYLAQQTVVQKDFPANVTEVVLSGRMGRHGFMPFYSKKDRAAAGEKLRLLNADHLADKSYRDLSGGQQQRVLLARALCATEKMLFLDEPVTGLDPLMSAELYTLLSDLNGKGLTIVMISHDVKSAVRIGNKILHLRTCPLFFGATDDYCRSEAGQTMLEKGRFAAEAHHV
ncbi:MAG: metal ABC transporter ATP-binding protein [Clostridiales Family XIII bacterium]|jgi:zinc transport system ATP-binding protein|nr:metal ABC transporter ATP-binding protein [Clostridiales Family XIII bacterium]